MGDPVRKQDSAEDVTDALVPVAMAPPKAPAPKEPAVAVDDRAPTVGDVLDPKRPSMAGASSVIVIDSVARIVEDIYDKVLTRTLDELKPTLAEVPVPKTDAQWVMKLIAWAVESVATATLGKLGGLASKSLFGAAESAEGAATGLEKGYAETIGEEAGKSAGKRLGDATGELGASPEPAREDDAEGAEHGATATVNGGLVEEYLAQQDNHLIVKKDHAITRLQMMKARAAKVSGADMAHLDEQLQTLISQNTLRDWFRQRVTLEWINLLARLSLGRRAKGQTTNFVGANAIGGFHEGGVKATKQWRGGEGFVDITVAVDDAGGLAVQDASVTGRPGAASVLKDLRKQEDANGTNYKLGSIPAFRRIWLRSGPTKLDVNPAFAITPEGALEVNFDDPVLAVLGGAKGLNGATGYDAYDGRSTSERSDRTLRATHAMIGAQRIVMLLATATTERLK
jgi:hypothetical protein